MKKMGVSGLLSSNALTKSTLILPTYLAPSFSSTKFLIEKDKAKDSISAHDLEKCHNLDQLKSQAQEGSKLCSLHGIFLRNNTNPARFMHQCQWSPSSLQKLWKSEAYILFWGLLRPPPRRLSPTSCLCMALYPPQISCQIPHYLLTVH